MKGLLMGGQASILYGAAEFSRDVDVAVAIDPRNLDRLRAALAELHAEPVFVPALSPEALRRGHACHFRCRGRGLHDVRVDVMSVMRGVDSFDALWRRRTGLVLPGVGRIAVLSIPDVVQSKKMQRDKDWPMIRRDVRFDEATAKRKPSNDRARFWLQDCRTPELLVELARRYPRIAAQVERRALRFAIAGDVVKTERELRREEARERERDRRYWTPLRAELERMRFARRLSRG